MAVSYPATLDWLERLETARGMELGLERLFPVLERLGDPQSRLEVVHVAGTNGKGSTAAMLESIYRTAGLHTGLYTSPHLRSFTERIKTGGRMISQDSVAAGVDRIREAMSAATVSLTYFEVATVLALLEFDKAAVDLAIIEVGLGGRLDATNVVEADTGLVTSIGLDHGAQLGSTLGEVAREKAGIIKSGMTVIVGRVGAEAAAELEARAASEGARLSRLGHDFEISEEARAVALAGSHQIDNAALACQAVRLRAARRPVSAAAIRGGLSSVRWPARLETVAESPTLILDAAHNPEGAAALSRSLAAVAPGGPRVLVFGAMADKDWAAMLAELMPAFDETVLVRADLPRAASPDTMKARLSTSRRLATFDAAPEGLRYAASRAGRDGTVVVAGSVFLSAELYELASGRVDPFAP